MSRPGRPRPAAATCPISTCGPGRPKPAAGWTRRSRRWPRSSSSTQPTPTPPAGWRFCVSAPVRGSPCRRRSAATVSAADAVPATHAVRTAHSAAPAPGRPGRRTGLLCPAARTQAQPDLDHRGDRGPGGRHRLGRRDRAARLGRHARPHPDGHDVRRAGPVADPDPDAHPHPDAGQHLEPYHQ